jgi:MYXO-CTERM domain-containing protein
MKKSITISLITIAFLLLPVLNALGQPPPPPPQDIPIDGGLLLLLLGGIAFAVRKFWRKSKNVE